MRAIKGLGEWLLVSFFVIMKAKLGQWEGMNPG
jgi:hypothetical protein